MVVTDRAIGTHGARIHSSPLAIVEFILDSFPKIGSPAQVLFTYLQGCFTSNPNNIKFLRCAFNITPNTRSQHQRRTNQIANSLES